MPEHKKYLVFINNGSYEGWKIHGEADDWEGAVYFYEDALSYGISEVIICQFCPLVILDGRNESREVIHG